MKYAFLALTFLLGCTGSSDHAQQRCSTPQPPLRIDGLTTTAYSGDDTSHLTLCATHAVHYRQAHTLSVHHGTATLRHHDRITATLTTPTATWNERTNELHASGPIVCTHSRGTLATPGTASLTLHNRRLHLHGPVTHHLTL